MVEEAKGSALWSDLQASRLETVKNFLGNFKSPTESQPKSISNLARTNCQAFLQAIPD